MVGHDPGIFERPHKAPSNRGRVVVWFGWSSLPKTFGLHPKRLVEQFSFFVLVIVFPDNLTEPGRFWFFLFWHLNPLEPVRKRLFRKDGRNFFSWFPGFARARRFASSFPGHSRKLAIELHCLFCRNPSSGLDQLDFVATFTGPVILPQPNSVAGKNRK